MTDPIEGNNGSPEGAEKSASSLESESLTLVLVTGSDGSAESASVLLRQLPASCPLCIVLLQGREKGPEFERLIKNLALRVSIASSETSLKKGQVLIVPAGKQAMIQDSLLVLQSNGDKDVGQADRFFLSAAEQAGTRTIGILLSGRGVDGVEGLRAIRAAGGVALVQDPQSAKHSELPAQAVSAGLADRVLSPAELGKEIISLATRLEADALTRRSTAEVSKNDLQPVLKRLLEKTGVDFSQYKVGTIQRRTVRRMALLGSKGVTDYVQYLDAHPEEVEELFEDLLIHVTSFFRDPDTYSALSEKVFPEILKSKKPAEAIRIWIPGCSTGEEVYSTAIALLECLDKARAVHPVQIFASDVSGRAIARAREGTYSESICRNVSEERLKKYFTRTDAGFRVVKRLRELCIFVQHDLTRNPPFSRLDLLSCRNLLIYLEPEFQERILQIFQLALRPGGYLVLSDSESIPGSGHLFSRVPKTVRFYTRMPGEPSVRFGFIASPPPKSAAVTTGSSAGLPQGRQDVEGQAATALLARHVPATFVVNDQLEILHLWGPVSEYLAPSPGKPELNLLKMLREELRADLRLGVHHASRAGKAVRREGLRLKDGARRRRATIEIEPLPVRDSSEERFFIVLVRDSSAAAQPRGKPGGSLRERASEEEIRRLREDLASTIEYSQSFVKEYEAVNANLNAANEEILSTNEELRSTNEELETAKEELQTANDEISTRNQNLTHLTADLSNLLSSSEIAILMLDAERRIRRATPRAQAVLNILPSDEGRPLADLKGSLVDVDLEALIDEASKGRGAAREVQDRTGRWYSLQVRPYRTSSGQDEGTVVSLHDIDVLKRREEEREQARHVLEESEKRFRRLADQAPVLIWMSGTDALCTYFNKPWLDFRGRTMEQELGNGWAEGVHPDDYDRCLKIYLESFNARQSFEMEYRLRHATGVYRWITDRGVPLTLSDGTFVGFIGACLDITGRREAEETTARLAAIVESSDDAIISKTLDGIVTSWNEAAERLFGYRADEILGKPITMIVPPERLLEEQDLLSRIAHGERVAHFETERRRKDGTLVPVSITVSPVKNPDGKTIGVSKTSRDITEQRRSEQEIRRLNADLERRVQERTASLETANRELETFTYTVAHDLRAPLRAMHRFCDLLTEEKAGNLDDEGRGWLCQIATGARRMDTLIENLLNYSRVGRTQVSKGPVDLAPLVLEIVQHIDADVKDRQATVKVDNHLPRVLGDRLLLLQVLMNLLSNAIKFVPRERKPIVQIRATREGDRVRVFVEDNGIGIEARHRDRVFRMFERLHGEEEYPGTGIGLAIVKRAVECMGGQVGFEPAEIQGTRFFIEIPAAE